MPRKSLLPPEDRAKLLARRHREGLTYPQLSAQSGIAAGTLKVWASRASALPARCMEGQRSAPTPGRGRGRVAAVNDVTVDRANA